MGYIAGTGIGRDTLYCGISTATLVYQRVSARSGRKIIGACIKSLIDTYIGVWRQAGVCDRRMDTTDRRHGHRDRIDIVACGVKYLYILRITLRSTSGTCGRAVSVKLQCDPVVIASEIVIIQLSPHDV
jgi:hypothetical protein